ncbi:MAG: chromate efflux transporter [Alphaproteobacteria bacterium]|nr:chromate efflux transporter [Alphaproteobacteria bacterium]
MNDEPPTSLLRIFLIFLRLGLTSFGGPVAHLGYFRHEFVERRKWLDEHAYADLVALCQFLPGPASSQVGIALGLSRGGILGALAAWLGFTLPSAIVLVLFGMGFAALGNTLGTGWLHGLKVVAVAVVAQALWNMARTLCPDRLRASVAIIAAIITALMPTTLGQIGVILASALFGWRFLKPSAALPHTHLSIPTHRMTGAIMLALFFALLLILPALATATGSYPAQLFDGFYRAGSLVFGGGHVVLPLLQAEVVPKGWVSNDVFLAGYGAAQAMPGPLFTFSAYLGSVSSGNPTGWLGAVIALTAVFLPSFLLIIGMLPFWESLRKYEVMQRAMLGINAAVVGLLLAAFYNPVWTSAILGVGDFILAAAAFLLLQFLKWPSWTVVLLTAIAAGVMG